MENFLRKITPKDYFSFHFKCLKLLGMLPPKKNRLTKIIYWVFAVPHFSIVCSPVLFELINVIVSDDKYERKILTIGMLFMHIEAVVRIITWFWMQNKFFEVISTIKRSTFDFEMFSDTCEKDHIFLEGNQKRRTSVTTHHKNISFKTSCFCTLWYISYMLYVIYNISTSYIVNVSQETHEKFNPWVNRTSTYREFVYPMWMPFDVSISDGYYLLAFSYQPYAFFFMMGGYLTLDCLYLNIITLLKSQVKVISYAVSHVDNIKEEKAFKNRNWIEQENRIVKCVQELQIIMNLAEKLDDMLNFIFLMHSGLILVTTCCLSYTATVAESFEMPHLMMMTSVVLIEVFTSCWFCYDFSLEFFNTRQAFYELDWHNYPPKLRTIIIFTLARLKNPPFFTMWKWTKIDIICFVNFLKMVYSFYTLISKSK